VYYQALTGTYPFDGKTGNEVMEAHLMHTVKPISEVRSEIPLWACDWIMWHINRYPQDRPESSRDALSVFLKNDRIPNSAMSTGMPKPVVGPPRPRLIIPGSGPATQALAKAKLVQTSQVTTLAGEAATISQTVPQPLAPPEGFKPSVHTSDEPPSTQKLPPSTQSLGQATQAAGPATQKLQGVPVATPGHPKPAAATARPTGRSASPAKQAGRTAKSAKTGVSAESGGKSKLILLAAYLVVVAGLVGLLYWQLVKPRLDIKHVDEILAQAEKTEPPAKMKVSSSDLDLLLSVMKSDSETKIASAVKGLTQAEASDSTDVDTRICDFITKYGDLPLTVKEDLIDKVLKTRHNPVILPTMMKLAASSKEPEVASAALRAARDLAGDSEFPAFLKLLETNDDERVRDGAEANLETVIKKSKKAADLAKKITNSRESNVKPKVQDALRRLSGVCDAVIKP